MNDTITIHYKDGTSETFTKARISHNPKSDSYWIRYNDNGQIKRTQVPRENVVKIHQQNPEG